MHPLIYLLVITAYINISMNHCLIFGVTNGGIFRATGAHRIANHLRLQGWDCEVVDFIEYWSFDQIKELLLSRVNENTKFFGFSITFNLTKNEQLLLNLVNWAKEKWPNLKFISGGHSVPFFPAPFDYHIMSYAEFALDELLKWLFSNGVTPVFDPLLKKGNMEVINATVHLPAHPFPEAVIKYEPRDFMTPTDHGVIEFSRGCIFQCKFCNFPVLGVRGDYTRSAESVYEQMMFNYDNYGVQDYGVSDETFNDRTEKIAKFADVVEKLPWKPYFSAFIRADLLISRPRDREELLRLGLHAHLYGIESFNAQSLKYIGKGMAPDRLKEGLIDVRNYFKKHIGHRFRASINLIAGLPHETLETMEETCQWIHKNWLDQTVTCQPLRINKDDEPRPSIVDESYDTLGYVEMTPEEQYAAINSRDGEAWVHLEYGHFELLERNRIWKNEHMNWYQAVSYSAKINGGGKKFGNIEKVYPLHMPLVYSDKFGNILTTDEKLKLYGKKTREAEEGARVYIQNYISKKLSL